MSRLLSFVRSLWIWTAGISLIVLWTPLLALIAALDRDPSRKLTARWFRRLGRAFGKIYPWRFRMSGLENVDPQKAYVIVSNHQSLVDIPVISHVNLDTKWLTKAELFRAPLVGYLLRLAGDIPVDRTDRRRAATALLQAARYLRQGCSIVAFPEGTRSPDGRVLPFQDGPFQLAIREGVPVLPMVINGSARTLSKDSLLFQPSRGIHLHILEPVSVEGLQTKESAALREAVRRQISDRLEAPDSAAARPEHHRSQPAD